MTSGFKGAVVALEAARVQVKEQELVSWLKGRNQTSLKKGRGGASAANQNGAVRGARQRAEEGGCTGGRMDGKEGTQARGRQHWQDTSECDSECS